MELRPLGFGEIFDRAITLYVRNFIPFAGIVSVVIVPLAILQYFYDRSVGPQFDEMFKIISHPNAPVPAHAVTPSILSSPLATLLFLAVVAIVWLIWPFALNACAVGIARLYRNRPVEFGACYRASLRRWGPVIGLLVMEVLVFIMWYVGFVILIVAMILFATLVARGSIAAGIIVGIFAVVVVLASLLLLAPLFVALTFAMNAIVIEEKTVFNALGSGFRRVFNRHEIWRSMLFSISALLVLMTGSSLVGVLALAAVYFHQYAIEVVLTSIFRAAFTPFSIVLLAVYYFDVRIRHEGFDLEASLDRLAGIERVA
ncbi:MAG: hypothetical protein JO199_10175 [Candidatus Eremiobacteraeota bacterium]|nr:hypothetical protein [Candidatus Eremiobacteraeota bacterium]